MDGEHVFSSPISLISVRRSVPFPERGLPYRKNTFWWEVSVAIK